MTGTIESIRGSRVLVTGAGGFIGCHLSEVLVQVGAQVTGLLRYGSAGNPGNLASLRKEILSEIHTVSGDVRDAEFVRSIVDGQDIVFHLAALIAIPYSYKAPRSYLHTNVEGTLNVLEAVRQCETPRLIHTSTSEVYGSARYVPIDEAHPLQGQSPYSASKIAADKLAEAYHRSFNVPVVTVRPFNTYGPFQSARAMIPATILQALWSPAVKLGATAPVRDMTYVTDTAAGFLAAAVTPGIEGSTYNLGTGVGYSVGDIAATILRLVGRNETIELDAERLRPDASEVDRLVSSNAAFHAVSGWRPLVNLESGLETTIAWFREQGRPMNPEAYIR